MAATSTSKKPKRRTVRDLLHLLGWSEDRMGSAGTACNLLADVVTSSGCRVWIGHLPAANDAHSVAGMLRQAADGDPERDSPIVSRGNLGAFAHANLLDAELIVNDVLKGFALLGMDPPASWGGLNQRARKRGGEQRKPDDLIQRLLNHAAQELAAEGLSFKPRVLISKLKMLHPTHRMAFGVSAIVVREGWIRVTDSDGTVHPLRRTSLWRYLKRAKQAYQQS